MLKRIKHFLFYNRKKLSNVDYWEKRSKKYGVRSVLNLSETQKIEAVTKYQIEQIFPYLKKELDGTEQIVLDYGCGPGRFTSALATLIQGQAIGVDPIERFLKAAPRSPSVAYQLLEQGKIPLANQTVDVIFVCLVLGGIPAEAIKEVRSELKRILKPNGILCLIENTTLKNNKKYWYFRSVDWYKKEFSFSKLKHYHDYYEVGGTISIMIGRYTNSEQ